jgi:hypothetical protein
LALVATGAVVACERSSDTRPATTASATATNATTGAADAGARAAANLDADAGADAATSPDAGTDAPRGPCIGADVATDDAFPDHAAATGVDEVSFCASRPGGFDAQNRQLPSRVTGCFDARADGFHSRGRPPALVHEPTRPFHGSPRSASGFLAAHVEQRADVVVTDSRPGHRPLHLGCVGQDDGEVWGWHGERLLVRCLVHEGPGDQLYTWAPGDEASNPMNFKGIASLFEPMEALDRDTLLVVSTARTYDGAAPSAAVRAWTVDLRTGASSTPFDLWPGLDMSSTNMPPQGSAGAVGEHDVYVIYAGPAGLAAAVIDGTRLTPRWTARLPRCPAS